MNLKNIPLRGASPPIEVMDLLDNLGRVELLNLFYSDRISRIGTFRDRS